MSYKDTNKIIKDVDYLNKRYGNGFGYKVFIITLISSLIFAAVVISIMFIIKLKDSNEEFLLDNNRKYIISNLITGENTYYEIDFSNKKIIKRQDSKFKREKLSTIKTDYINLEQILKEIVQDEANLTFTNDEKNKLYKEGIYIAYKITDYNQKEYYIKDKATIQKVEELLKNNKGS